MQTCIRPSRCHCHSLSLASVKSRLVLPFWYWFTWVVPEKGPLNGCVCYGLLHVDHSYTVLHSVACCAELAVERLTLNSYRLHLRSAQSRSRLTDSSCVGIPLTRHLAGHKMFSPSVCTCDSSSLSPTLLHPFNGPFSGTTQVSRYQKGKTNLDFTEARDSGWQWHLLGHMQVCTLL